VNEGRAFWENYLTSFDSFYEGGGFLNRLRKGNLRRRWEHTSRWLYANTPSGGTVLEVGCGTGRHTVQLLARGYRMVCNDLTDRGVEIVRRRMDQEIASGRVDKTARDRISFHRGDAGAIELPRADSAFALGVIDYVEDQAAFLANILRSSSRLVFTFPKLWHWKTLPRKLIEKPRTWHHTEAGMAEICRRSGYRFIEQQWDVGGHVLLAVHV
jgi:SAM-dependent methyltransferase